MVRFLVLFAIGALLLSQPAHSQKIFSPYSANGIGEVMGDQMVNDEGASGLGLSHGSPFYLNNINPALLVYNPIHVYSAGLSSESRKIQQLDSDGDKFGGMNLKYFAAAYPLKSGKVTASVGLAPFSSANYKYQYVQNIENGQAGDIQNVFVTNEGSGGINKLFIATGFKITKNLSLGIKANRLFSSINQDQTYTLNDTIGVEGFGNFSSKYYQQFYAKDWIFTGGIAFQQPLGENYSLEFGATYESNGEINGELLQRSERLFSNGGVVAADTLSDINASINIPAAQSVGLSFARNKKWAIGGSLTLQNWSEFESALGGNDGLKSVKKWAVGGDIIPNAASVSNYFARASYRAGVEFGDEPYSINGEQLKNLGINFGISLPVSGFSSLDLGFKYGTRGTLDNGGIKEDYFRINLGVTFNDGRWFMKPKYN